MKSVLVKKNYEIILYSVRKNELLIASQFSADKRQRILSIISTDKSFKK